MSNTPSITKRPVFRPKTNKVVYMEDIGAAKVALIDALAKRGIEMTPEEENLFWDSLGLFLEESFNWPDYRAHL